MDHNIDLDDSDRGSKDWSGRWGCKERRARDDPGGYAAESHRRMLVKPRWSGTRGPFLPGRTGPIFEIAALGRAAATRVRNTIVLANIVVMGRMSGMKGNDPCFRKPASFAISKTTDIPAWSGGRENGTITKELASRSTPGRRIPVRLAGAPSNLSRSPS